MMAIVKAAEEAQSPVLLMCTRLLTRNLAAGCALQ